MNRFRLWLRRTHSKWLATGRIRDLFRYTVEDRLLDDFYLEPGANIDSLIAYMKLRSEFEQIEAGVFVSRSGRVMATFSFLGLDVFIDNGPMLDYRPEYYRITRDDAYELHDAIAINVPGSVQHEWHQKGMICV